VSEIKADGKEAELFELMDFADNICKSGAQSQTGMCKRLQNALERLKNAAPSSKEAITVSKTPKKEIPEVVIEGKKITEETPAKTEIIKTIKKVTEVVAVDTSPVPEVDICEPEVNGTPFERSTPRDGEVDFVTSRDETYWSNTFKAFKGEKDWRPTGFELSNVGPNEVADGAPIEPSQRVERNWRFVSDDHSQKETYLWITDDSGTGKFSHLMDTIIMIVPRKMVPTVEVVGQDLHVTLTTGEKIIYDKDTRVIKGGVLSEGKVDMNPDRFKKKFAPIKYSGTGISIRVDKRGEDPRLIPGNAVVTQNGKTCQVPAKDLWGPKADFKFADDSGLVTFLNSKCGKKFSL